MWVYIRTRDDSEIMYVVGFYDPSGIFQPDSDFFDRDEARERVHYLNGGKNEKNN